MKSSIRAGASSTPTRRPARVWMQRLLAVYHQTIWLNPQPEAVWDYHESIRITRQLMGERMFRLPWKAWTEECAC